MDIEEYVKRRNEILLSFDVEEMKKLCREVGTEIPEDETVFIAGMHLARLEVTAFSDEIKAESLGWLHANNFNA